MSFLFFPKCVFSPVTSKNIKVTRLLFAMRINLFLTLIGLCFSIGVNAQSISGKVIDNLTGEPLPGATVYVTNYPASCITNQKGEYFMEVRASGVFHVKVSFVGYQSQVKDQKIGSVQKTGFIKKDRMVEEIAYSEPVQRAFYLLFEMEPLMINQDEVVVTGTRTATARNNIPLTTSVINQTQLEHTSEINLLPLLSNKVPGLFVTQRGFSGFGIADGAAGKISLRGIGSAEQSQLLVMIDGQPQFMGIFGHGFPDMYNTSNLEKVEVVRGPASLLYGTNAMGGVINMITKRNTNEGWSGALTGQYGSYGTLRGIANGGYKNGGFSFWASMNHDQTEGHRPSSGFRGDNLHTGIGYVINDHFNLRLTGAATNFHSVDPGPVADSLLYANNSHWADVTRINSMFSFKNTFDRMDGQLNVFYNQGDHDIYTNWKSLDRNYGVSLFEAFRFFTGNMIGVGFDWNRYGGQGNTVEPFNKWFDVTESGVYAFVQQSFFKKITLNVGLRYQMHSLYDVQLIPQLGTTIQLSESNEIKAVASKGYRSPNMKELYFFPPSNPDLEPESMWNYEIGYTRYMLNKRLKTAVNVFYLDGKNLIQAVPNAAGSFPPATNRNTGDFMHFGGELEAIYRMYPNLTFDASYAYLHMDAPKLAAPKHQVQAGFMYVFGRFDINASAQWIGQLYTRTDNLRTNEVDETAVHDYVNMSVRMNYNVLRNISVFVSGNNLLNQTYEIQYGYPMPGITAMAGIKIKLKE
jgi:outer membrane cobalamin receptor